jgi:ABC-type polysaccharide/polyol phosphate transport system ATPase subunit
MSRAPESSTAVAPIAVSLENVTVAFRSYKERATSLKEALLRLLRRGRLKRYETFHALHKVTLQIPRGCVFGIIGSNGSGKSTMLKVISQVLPPTSGRVDVSGRVASLIELGAGFDPELNAIENIFLHGALHRRSRSFMEKRIEHILEFAELKEFAHTPIKYYSSGMFARLGFSVAVDIEPDILIVDEILAVGDERFHEKCNKVIEELKQKGTTIILVSHDLLMIEKLCHRCVVLARGVICAAGTPEEAIKTYRDASYQVSLN